MSLAEFNELRETLRLLADLKARYPDWQQYHQSWELLNGLYEQHWIKFVGKDNE